jgi:hypothetical protein
MLIIISSTLASKSFKIGKIDESKKHEIKNDSLP